MTARQCSVVLAIGILLTGYTSSRADSSYVWVVLDPPSTNPAPGGTFTTALKATSWNGAGGALDVEIHFDQTILQIQDFLVPTNSVFSGNCFADETSFSSGITKVVCFQTGTTNAWTNAVTIGDLRWKVVGRAGSTAAVFLVPASVVDAGWKRTEVAAYGTQGPVSMVDDDGDGIPDSWELSYFASLTNVTATSDSDGDGFLDRLEYLAGTDPQQGSSALVLRAPIRSQGAEGPEIKWQSVNSRRYTIKRASDLHVGFHDRIATNILGTPPENSYRDNSAQGGGPYFYRVVAE